MCALASFHTRQPKLDTYDTVASQWSNMALLSQLFHPFVEQMAREERQRREVAHHNLVYCMSQLRDSGELPPLLAQIGFDTVSSEVFEWAWMALQTRSVTLRKAAYTKPVISGKSQAAKLQVSNGHTPHRLGGWGTDAPPWGIRAKARGMNAPTCPPAATGRSSA